MFWRLRIQTSPTRPSGASAPEVLVHEEAPKPAPKPGEALVRVRDLARPDEDNGSIPLAGDTGLTPETHRIVAEIEELDLGPERDEEARATLQRLFPTREVVGIDCTDLVWGLGAFHCVTQQWPLAGEHQ